MAYFRQNDTGAQQPYQEEWSGFYPVEEDDLEEFTEPVSPEEMHLHWRVLAGISDFFGVVLGVVVILLLVMMLVSMYSWVRRDIVSSFVLLGSGLR